MMYVLKKEVLFEAAHCLPKYDGKCKNLHGHQWKIVIEIGADHLDDQGMVLDFALINLKIRNEYDHSYLNSKIETPTAEIIAASIWDMILELLDETRHIFLSVTVVETPGAEIKYSRELGWMK